VPFTWVLPKKPSPADWEVRNRPDDPAELSLEPEDFVGKCARQNSLPRTADSGQRFQPAPRPRHRVGILSFFNPPPFIREPQKLALRRCRRDLHSNCDFRKEKRGAGRPQLHQNNNSIKTRRPHRAAQVLLTACEYKLEKAQRLVPATSTPISGLWPAPQASPFALIRCKSLNWPSSIPQGLRRPPLIPSLKCAHLCFQSPDWSVTTGQMKDSALSPFMTLEELSEYLRISKRTIYRLLRRGTIRFHRIGSEVRFKKSEIDQWITKRCRER